MRAVVFGGVRDVRVADVPDADGAGAGRRRRPRDADARSAARTSTSSTGRPRSSPATSWGTRRWASSRPWAGTSSASRPGDRVVVAFNIACGACWFCRRGEHQLCDDFRNLGAGAFGGSLAGAQATHVRVPVADVNLLHIPEGMDDERALFVGDILTTGVYAASIADIEPGSTVAVVGCGPVGFFCAQAARAFGAGRVFARRPGARPARPRGERRRRGGQRRGATSRQRARRGHGRPRRGRGDRGRGDAGRVRERRRHGPARRPRRRGRGVRGRDRRAAARRLLGARADAPILRHLPGPRVVGARRWTSWSPAASIRRR